MPGGFKEVEEERFRKVYKGDKKKTEHKPVLSFVDFIIHRQPYNPFRRFRIFLKNFMRVLFFLALLLIASWGVVESAQAFAAFLGISLPLIGILMAVIGAFGQGFGLVLSKLGMKDYNPFAATQIRIIAGLFGLGIIISFSKKWKTVLKPVRNIKTMSLLSLGAIFGSFLGISFSLLAIKYTNTGVASTIMAIQPILLIPASMIIFQEKVNVSEVIGALIAVAGIALFFI